MNEKANDLLYDTISLLKPEKKRSGYGNVVALVVFGLFVAVIVAVCSFAFFRFVDNFSKCQRMCRSVQAKYSEILATEEPINGASYKIFLVGESSTDYMDRCLFWRTDSECLHEIPKLKESIQASLARFDHLEACSFADFTKLVELGSDLAILKAKQKALEDVQGKCRSFYNRVNECGTGSYVNTEAKRSRTIRDINEALSFDVYYETGRP